MDDDKDENHDLDLASTEDEPHLDRVVTIIHLIPLKYGKSCIHLNEGIKYF